MYKLVLCGNYSVGKTSLVIRLIRNIFNQTTPATIGASFLTWKPDPREKDYYGIWDTAGQERFAELLPLYFRDAQAVVYCWDCRNEFDERVFEAMYSKVREYTNGIFYVALMKSDLYGGIDFNPLKEWIKTVHDAGGVFITSSQTGQGVRELFLDIDKKLRENPPKPKVNADRVSLANSSARSTRKCC